MAPERPVTVVETALFLRQAESVWSPEERSTFVDFIARNPTAGDVVPDTGGVRKVRWSRRGSGKRGGVRVIHFFHGVAAPVYLLMVYAKAQQEDLSPRQKQVVQTIVAELKQVRGRVRTP